MKKLLIRLLGLFVISGHAATFTAATTSLADVRTAYHLTAATGDTLAIPAGTSTWSGSITITNSVIITGLTTNVTVIYNSQGGENPLFFIQPVSDVPITFKKMRLRSSVGAPASSSSGNGITCEENHAVVPTKVRITEMVFQELNFALALGACFGVCDNCDFINDRLCMRYPGFYTTANLKQIPAPPWGWDTTNSFVIEDCHFHIDNTAPDQYWGDTELPAAYTVRYCKFDMLKTVWYDGWDMHGDAGWPSGAQNRVGPQVYANTFHLATSQGHRAINFRGGENSLFYSNRFDNYAESWWSINPSGSHRPTNSYHWDNIRTDTGSPIEVNYLNGVTQGVDVFNSKPAAFAQLTYPHPLRGGLPPPPDPLITVQPVTQVVGPGQSATFNVTASGGSTLHYQWKYNGSNVGTDQNSYTKNNVQIGDHESMVQVTVSDLAGSTDSDVVMLNVVGSIVKFAGTVKITGAVRTQ